MKHEQSVLNSTNTQSNGVLIKQKAKRIIKIKEVMQTEELNTSKNSIILTLIETEDKRIACGGGYGRGNNNYIII